MLYLDLVRALGNSVGSCSCLRRGCCPRCSVQPAIDFVPFRLMSHWVERLDDLDDF